MQLNSAAGHQPPHPATLVTVRPPHPATVAQRSESPTRHVKHAAVQRAETQVDRNEIALDCIHCNSFLKSDALLETELVKVTRCIFKSSLYVISKRHREEDALDAGIGHLHETVQIARGLSRGELSIFPYHNSFWSDYITHVIMHIGPTKKKSGNSYDGYEHFHSFIVLDPANKKLENEFRPRQVPLWASNTSVGTELWGDVYSINYAADSYELAVEHLYKQERKQLVRNTTPVYFSITFARGAPTTTFFSI
ncbi:hypothetical protein ACMHYB_49240 [Sorangium sp. So ce1128]